MKKLLILATFLILQGCATTFLVNQADGALRYEAIAQLPKEEVINQRAYVGGQIITVDPVKRQVELITRHINNSGYPQEGSNSPNQRIFVNFAPDAYVNLYDLRTGDRMTVIGQIMDVQDANIAGNQLTIVQVQVHGDNYRTWSSYETNRRDWDDSPFLFNSFFISNGYYRHHDRYDYRRHDRYRHHNRYNGRHHGGYRDRGYDRGGDRHNGNTYGGRDW